MNWRTSSSAFIVIIFNNLPNFHVKIILRTCLNRVCAYCCGLQQTNTRFAHQMIVAAIQQRLSKIVRFFKLKNSVYLLLLSVVVLFSQFLHLVMFHIIALRIEIQLRNKIQNLVAFLFKTKDVHYKNIAIKAVAFEQTHAPIDGVSAQSQIDEFNNEFWHELEKTSIVNYD